MRDGCMRALLFPYAEYRDCAAEVVMLVAVATLGPATSGSTLLLFSLH